jgi:hypothetical protein
MRQRILRGLVFMMTLVSCTILLNLFAWTVAGTSFLTITDPTESAGRFTMQILFYLIGIVSPVLLLPLLDD